jgi:ATP-dependent Clp protease protease subunit
MGAGFSIYAKDSGKRAEIYIYEDVGEGWFGGFTAKQFSSELTALGKSLTQIDLHINSYGGDVFDGLAIYNLLVQHPARVHSHVDGVAASIASVITMAGDEVHVAENAQLMIHNAWGIAMGDAEAMRKRADLLDSVTGKIADVYVARTKMSSKDVRAMMAEETWLTAEDALAKGFADSITENMRIAAYSAPSALYAFRNAPSIVPGGAAPRPLITLSAEELALRDTVQQQQNRLERQALMRPAPSRSPAGAPAAKPAATTRKTQ